MAKLIALIASVASLLASSAFAQTAASSQTTAVPEKADLKFVVYFSRHGVRSPTGKAAQYNIYSSGTWPAWDVAPGTLTAHGYHLMELFGGFDRLELVREGLLSPAGCAEANQVTFYADSDQRTRETGNALAKGLFPGCKVAVPSLAGGTNDPLFHLSPEAVAHADSALAAAAIAGRTGGNVANLTETYRPQIAAFDTMLASCGKGAAKRTSLLDIPASLSAGQGDRLVELRGPINTASTLAENILLEYTEGMDKEQVGWGCFDGDAVRSVIGLHTAATDFAQRTPVIAKLQAAKLLEQIEQSMQQAVEQKRVPGALSKAADRGLFLIGHDTNLLNMAGALNLTWIADRRRDDTAPGSTLIFELWKRRDTGSYEVRTYFSVQTLEQMRAGSALTLESPPERVPVFITGCSRADFSCSWVSFAKTMEDAQR